MKKVTIYALSTCLWCRKTKKYFEAKHVPFDVIEYDKQDEARQAEIMAEIKASGGTGSFPFVKIGGATTQGFDPGEFEKMLGGK